MVTVVSYSLAEDYNYAAKIAWCANGLDDGSGDGDTRVTFLCVDSRANG